MRIGFIGVGCMGYGWMYGLILRDKLLVNRILDIFKLTLYVEKQFIETLGKPGASGLSELFSPNDENAKVISYDGQEHYRTFLALGQYLTLLGESSLSNGAFSRIPTQIAPSSPLKETP